MTLLTKRVVRVLPSLIKPLTKSDPLCYYAAHRNCLSEREVFYLNMNKLDSYLSGKIQRYAVTDNPVRNSYNFRKLKKSFYIPLVVIVAVVVLVLVVLLRNSQLSGSSTLGASDQRIEVQKPRAEQDLNKKFAFPLLDDKGKEVSKIKYEILDAELRDEIIVKGKMATSVKGRTFLILNLKITNDYNKSISINTRDYIRLTANSNKEKLAPEIHNDPVEIQANSTKYTRVGFPINDTDKDMKLSVGEINGSKQDIALTLKP
jgi:hypothetical protein